MSRRIISMKEMRRTLSMMTLQLKPRVKPPSPLTKNSSLMEIHLIQRVTFYSAVKLGLIHSHHSVVRVMMAMEILEAPYRLAQSLKIRTMATLQQPRPERRSKLLVVPQEATV
jgi:hypothetical protein